MLRLLLRTMLAIAAMIGVSATWNSAAASPEGWAALREPGAIAIMRHALAPGTGDPAAFRLDDCSTQRNLDERGRDQARSIGAAFRANGIGVDRVMSSQWCRCLETAELLGFGAVEPLPSLNSFFRDYSRRDAQTAETKAFLGMLPAKQRVVLVTHQVNITALTGAYPASGEVFVLQVNKAGDVEVTGRILIAP